MKKDEKKDNVAENMSDLVDFINASNNVDAIQHVINKNKRNSNEEKD